MSKSPGPYKTFLFQEVEPRVAQVTLNRPDKLNAMNKEMVEDFEELLGYLAKDEAYRVLILTGAGRGFCSGADLKEATAFKDTQAFADPESFLRMVQERYAGIILGLRNIPQPVIAAVNGPAAGGGFALALAADVRVAAPEAYFVASFINIGLSAGEMGSSYILPRLVGQSRAAEILLTGRKVGAGEAEKIGLVSKVVPREELLDTAISYARMMTAKTVGGLKLTKKVLDQNLNAPSLEQAIHLENRNQTLMIFSGDFHRLIQAFLAAGEKD
jgi:enoyl-CoA hydratase